MLSVPSPHAADARLKTLNLEEDQKKMSMVTREFAELEMLQRRKVQLILT